MKRIPKWIIRFFKPPSEKAAEDLFLLAAFILLAVVFGIRFEDFALVTGISEKIGFLHAHEHHYHLNVIACPPLFVFILGLSWYSWRRWKDSHRAILKLEKKVAERTSELQRFKDLIDQINDSIIIADPRTAKVVEFNKRACSNLGYTKEELLGLTILDIEMTIPTMRLWEKHVAEVKEKKIIVYEGVRKRKNGTTFPAELTVNYIIRDNKEFMVGIIHDISERIKSEEDLKESEERFRSLTETSPDWIWCIDEKGVYTYASPKIEDILGYKPEDIIGKKPFDLMPNTEAKRVLTEFKYYENNEIPIERLENINIHKNGQLVVLETSAIPLFNDQKKIIGWQGVDRDITDRKKMEKELLVQKAYMEKLFQESPEAIALLDNEAKIIKINKNYSDLFGYSEEEAIGKCLDDLIIPKRLKEEAIKATKKITSGETTDFESIRKNKKGLEIPVSILGHPIILNNDQLAIYVIYRDITKQKEAYERLLESYKHLGIINRQLEMLAFLRNYKGESKQQALQYILTCAKNFSREKYILIYEYKDNYNFSLLKSTGCGKAEQKLKNISVKSWESLKKLVDKNEYVFTSKDLGDFTKINTKVTAFLALPMKKDDKLKGMLVVASDEITRMNDHIEFYNVFTAHSSKILEDYL